MTHYTGSLGNIQKLYVIVKVFSAFLAETRSKMIKLLPPETNMNVSDTAAATPEAAAD